MPTANLISLAVLAVFFVVQIACDIYRVEEKTSLDEEPKTEANRAERNHRAYLDACYARQISLEELIAGVNAIDEPPAPLEPPPLRAIATER